MTTHKQTTPSSAPVAGAPKVLPISTTWVPLYDYIRQWTCLDESYRTEMVLSTISSALNAFTLEMRALRQYTLGHQARWSGRESEASLAFMQTLSHLREASSHWLDVFPYLRAIMADPQYGEASDQQHLRALFVQATEHLERLGHLSEQAQGSLARLLRSGGTDDALAHADEAGNEEREESKEL